MRPDRLPTRPYGELLAPALLCSALLLALTGCGRSDIESETPPEAGPPRVAFTLEERDLLPENLAHDPVTGDFFVGSTRKGKIVRVTADGTASDFVGPRAEGMWMVMGMKVDARARRLWVASADGGNLEGHQGGRGNASGLFAFSLEDGSLVDRWTVGEEGGTHFFNDLELGPQGNVYITHMFNAPAVWVLEEGASELQIFARPGRFKNPNGLTFGDDGRLYVAHAEGVSSFDTATAERLSLDDPNALMTSPADGLYFHGSSLIGIHPTEGVVRRYHLDGQRRTIVDADVLAEDDPQWNDPLTGVLVGDTLYYIANSQYGRLSNGALPPLDELQPVTILAIDLAG